MNRLQRLLGLGLRAGSVVIGVEGVRAGIRRGRCRLVVLARDASPRARQRLERLAAARGVPQVVGPPAAELGAWLGRPPVMAVGVGARELARGLAAVAGDQAGMEV
jgi:ribosomal protein L7Ae-like RNA K-turn-binding protein